MSLYRQLQQRAAQNKPVRIGLIGAGKFGSMYLAQIPRTPGVHLVGIADLSPAAARTNLARVGWPAEQAAAASLDEALRLGTTHIGEDWQQLVSHPAIDVIVECTGHPIAAVDHCLTNAGEQVRLAHSGRTKGQQIVSLRKPTVGFGQRHDVRLGQGRHHREVELFEAFAWRQLAIRPGARQPPGLALSQLVAEQGAQETLGRPALTVGLLGQIGPQPLHGR